MEEKPIFNRDLIQNPKKYDIQTLIKNIRHLSRTTILNTQIVDASFCNQYILDVPIESGDEDSYIFIQDVLETQPHIKEEDLCYING